MSANKLHILFVSTWFPNRLSGLNGDFVQRHAKAVSSLHKVSVLHVEGDAEIDKSIIEKHKTNENYQEIVVFFPKSQYSIINFFRKFRSYQLGRREIEEFDLIHANVMYYNLFWVLIQRLFHQKKYVITEHSTEFYGKMSWFKRFFNKILGKYAAKILPVSRKLQEAMQKQGLKGDFEVIPNVVDTTLFEAKTDSLNQVPIFLHVSMLLDSHKNITGQLNAVKILADKGYKFEFHIGGNGDLKPILEFIEKNQLQHYIKTFGTLTHQEVSEKMKQADAFILFSFKENQPCVIIESFAVGTPVIASDVGGISEFFPSNFGEIIPSNDVDELVNKMEDFIQQKKYASAREMHVYVENNFSVRRIAERFDQVYQSIISKK